MAAPLDASWNNNTLSDSTLGEVTVGKGTSFPSTWEVGRMFLRTDEPKLYYNSGTEGTPVWSVVLGAIDANSTPTDTGTDFNHGTGKHTRGEPVTIGTTGDDSLYVITDIEVKTGDAVSGNAVLTAFIVDADPPVSTLIQFVGGTALFASVASTTHKIATTIRIPFVGGTIVAPFVASSALSEFKANTAHASQNMQFGEAMTESNAIVKSITWAANTREIDSLKLYWTEYS